MARKLRIEYSGGRLEPIFWSDDDRLEFLKTLAKELYLEKVIVWMIRKKVSVHALWLTEDERIKEMNNRMLKCTD